jgi:hypothetical protein
MGWFSWFSSGPKVVDDVFDKDSGLLTQVGSWIGNQSFTQEEVAELNAGIAKDVRAYAVATLDESTDRSKARRTIAVNVIQFYLLILFISGMVYPIDVEWSKVWIEIATSWTLGGLVSSISIFFYGSHALSKYQGGKKA